MLVGPSGDWDQMEGHPSKRRKIYIAEHRHILKIHAPFSG